MQPQEEAPADSLVADELPLPVWAAKVENWMVERLLPHFGHSGPPFLAVVMRPKRVLHSSQTYS